MTAGGLEWYLKDTTEFRPHENIHPSPRWSADILARKWNFVCASSLYTACKTTAIGSTRFPVSRQSLAGENSGFLYVLPSGKTRESGAPQNLQSTEKPLSAARRFPALLLGYAEGAAYAVALSKGSVCLSRCAEFQLIRVR